MTENKSKMKSFLEEYLHFFETVLEDEKEKFKNFTSLDIKKINESITKQQANQLMIQNMEEKRMKIQDSLGFKDMTFQEIIKTYDEKKEMNELYQKLQATIHNIQFFNQKAMDLAKGQIALFETVKTETTYTKGKQKVEAEGQMIKEKF